MSQIGVVGPDTLTPTPAQPGPDYSLYFPDPEQVQSVLAEGAFGYRVWECWGRTRGKTGWKVMAAAGDDSQQPVAGRPVKLHAAVTRFTVYYHAVRLGDWPQLPDPRPDPSSGLTLLVWDDRVKVSVSPNATEYLCTARGRRVYASLTPIYGWVTGLMVPVPPCCTAAKGTLNVPPGKFTQGII
jgi:hypothetical protein